MKKIVILTCYFPPQNIVGARRPYYFAKYLQQFGNDVTVVTSESSQFLNTLWKPDNLNFNFKIIYLNRIKYDTGFFYSRLYNWAVTKKNEKSVLKKILRNISIMLLPVDFENKLDFNVSELKDKIISADYIIASGPPWTQFYYGSELKKALNAKLILDYRDPWTIINDEVSVDVLNNYGKGISGFLKKSKYQLAEFRYTKNADAILSVSQPILTNSAQITSINKGKIIYNGFDENEAPKVEFPPSEKFEISFTGIMRMEMNVGFFLNALVKILEDHPSLLNEIRINFIGSDMPGTEEAIKDIKSFKYYKEVINLTSFVDKRYSIATQKNSNLLLIFSYGSTKGIMSSKIFQYLEAQKHILLISNTDDVMEDLVKRTNSGFICKSEEEIYDLILRLYNKWKKGEVEPYLPNIEEVKFYSFEKQVCFLNEFIHEL